MGADSPQGRDGSGAPADDACPDCQRFVADRDRLATLCHRALAAVDATDLLAPAGRWSDLREAVTLHLNSAASMPVPALFERSRAEASALVAEHRYLARRLRELDAIGATPYANASSVRQFVDELRAHLAHEQRVHSQCAAGEFAPACVFCARVRPGA